MYVEELYVKDRMAIAITSMVKRGKKIYLGLTGGPNILASYNLNSGEIEIEKELFPWIKDKGYCGKIHNAMGKLSDDSLLIGEGTHFTWDGLPVTADYLRKELPPSLLDRKKTQGYEDIVFEHFCLENLEKWDRPRDNAGGRIIRYYPETKKVKDLGMIAPYLYVQSMVVDGKNNRAFGHTIPDNHFFCIDVGREVIRDYGHISAFANHNMVVTTKGICYGGWIDKAANSLKLLKFNPAEERLHHLDKLILGDPGLSVQGNVGIDQWIVTSKGDIYVGMVANSLLFQFFPEEEEFELVGQVAEGGRVTTLNEDEDGIIWIGAGFPNMHLIRFDPSLKGKAKFADFGPVNKKHQRCYFHASCYHENRLLLGETDGFSPSLHIINLTQFDKMKKRDARFSQSIRTVDSHTMGEPTRIITGGVPCIPGRTMTEKKKFFQKKFDDLRKLLMLEPRGHKDMFGALITPPAREMADIGVIFMDGGGYLNMCGHGSIGVATVVVETELVPSVEPLTRVLMDTPAGLVEAKVEVEGGICKKVTILNVPSFLYKSDVEVILSSNKKILVDIAFGGNFFVLINADHLGIKICSENLDELKKQGLMIRKMINEQVKVRHPQNSHINSIDLAMIYSKLTNQKAHSKDVVILGRGQIDRSPCGTGTSALMSLLYARGELDLDEEYINEGIIGTRFRGILRKEVKVGQFKTVIPEITGSAYITGYNRWVMDPDDPLKYGFTL